MKNDDLPIECGFFETNRLLAVPSASMATFTATGDENQILIPEKSRQWREESNTIIAGLRIVLGPGFRRANGPHCPLPTAHCFHTIMERKTANER